MFLYDDRDLVRVKPGDDCNTGVYGPKSNAFYKAYLSECRKDDVPVDKPPLESDTSDSRPQEAFSEQVS